MIGAAPEEKLSLESLVAQLADEFMERLKRGEQPEIDEYVQRYPDQEAVIRQVLPSLRLIRVSAANSRVTLPPSDGSRLASGSVDKTIKLWDPVTAREILTLRGHAGYLTDLTFSLDGRRILSRGITPTDPVRIWDATPWDDKNVPRPPARDETDNPLKDEPPELPP